MGIKFEFSLLGRSHIHWGETGYQDVIVEVSYDDLAALALANGYVKLADDEIIAKRGTSGEICFGTVNVDQVARKFGYVKLQPGQVVLSREAAAHAYEVLTDELDCLKSGGDTPCPTCERAVAELRAALEVE